MSKTKKLTLAAFYVAIGVVLPVVFHQFTPGWGLHFKPMSLPIIVAGLTLGPFYGVLVALTSVFGSFVFSGMPQYPMLVVVLAECLVFGLISGVMSGYSKKGIKQIYTSIVAAQIGANLTFYLAALVMMPVLVFQLPFPGILLQLTIVPLVVLWIIKYDRKS